MYILHTIHNNHHVVCEILQACTRKKALQNTKTHMRKATPTLDHWWTASQLLTPSSQHLTVKKLPAKSVVHTNQHLFLTVAQTQKSQSPPRDAHARAPRLYQLDVTFRQALGSANAAEAAAAGRDDGKDPRHVLCSVC